LDGLEHAAAQKMARIQARMVVGWSVLWPSGPRELGTLWQIAM